MTDNPVKNVNTGGIPNATLSNIVDNIVVAEQIGRINKEQATEISQMIGDFENRNKGKEL